ncbi:MAG: efflux transporter, family, subunit [Planctomycetaceae bacterium]|nr:efflux transporter, family, subunit [Planctomycetaceae bacterium]
MTTAGTTPVAVQQSAQPTVRSGRLAKILSTLQFLFALGVTVGVLAFLLISPSAHGSGSGHPIAPTPVVEVVGPRLIRVTPGTPLDGKLQHVTAGNVSLTVPVLTVTGRVAASLRPGNVKGKDYWQFEAPEVLTAFSDWEKAQADIVFNETQLIQVQALAAAREASQRKVVERLTKLVNSGTESFKSLAAEETQLLQFQITGKKEVYDAQSAIRISRRSEAVTARQLQLGGLEPELLRSAPQNIDIVMADVPEGRLTQVKVGQSCVCQFFGLPHQLFSGKLNSIAPTLSKERRSLRVLLVIDDPHDLLRPGMTADVGLGTDPRQSLMIPTDAILHVTRTEYVLVSAGNDLWRATEVQVGEPRNGEVEILDGLKPGDVVMGKGAILLKPMIILSLDAQKQSQDKTDALPPAVVPVPVVPTSSTSRSTTSTTTASGLKAVP